MKLRKRFIAALTVAALVTSTNITYLPVRAGENENDTAKQETTAEETVKKVTLDVNIPNEWTNSLSNWAITYDVDAELYYQVGDDTLDENCKGYTVDNIYTNAKKWDISTFESGTGYIKFWAVKEDEETKEKIFSMVDAQPYKYDITEPETFELTSAIIGNKSYIKSKEPLTDSESGIANIYYRIQSDDILYGDLQGIKNNCQEVGQKEKYTESEIEYHRFEIEYNNEEHKDKVIVVYVVDNAGNIRHSSLVIPDTSAPVLNVLGVDANSWVNEINWDISKQPSDNVDVYYKTLAKNPSDNSEPNSELWGNYTDAKLWNFDYDEQVKNDIPEGENYIHFWAVYENEEAKPEHQVAEVTKTYKYDHTAPGDFAVHMLGPYRTRAVFNLIPIGSILVDFELTDLKDEISGISRVTYKLGEQGEEKDINIQDGIYKLSKYKYKELQDENGQLIFTVYDNAGNSRSTKKIHRGENISEDSKDIIPPVVQSVSVVTKQGNKESVQYVNKVSQVYGSVDKGNYDRSIYTNQNDYLKITVNEEDLRDIVLDVGGEEKSFNIADMEKDNSTYIISTPEQEDNTFIKEYYIPISAIIELSDHDSKSIKVSAKDTINTSKEFIFNDSEEECNIVYDNGDNKDPKINIDHKSTKVDDKNYYGKQFNDSLVVNLKDDIGLKNYKITLVGSDKDENGNAKSKLIYEYINDEYKGKEKIEQDLSAGKEHREMISKEENGEFVEKQISYKKIIKEYTQDIVLDNEKYPNDGHYQLVVNAEDLAGNKSTQTYDFYIDRTSPVIVDQKYTETTSILRYLAYGIFGKQPITDLTITVIDANDDLSPVGVDENQIYFCYKDNNAKDIKIKAEKDKDNTYKFIMIPLGIDVIPYIEIQDKLGNTAKYYFTTENGKLAGKDATTTTHLVLEDTTPTSKITLPEERQYKINGEVWYPGDITYTVTAKDEKSGLNKVIRTETNTNNNSKINEITEDGIQVNGQRKKFIDLNNRYTQDAEYSYIINKEGNYQIEVNAEDNAGNEIPKNNRARQIVHIDKTNPEIERFQIGTDADQGASVEYGTYGYYFLDDTAVRVYVKDNGNSSGIDYVVLYTKDINGTQRSVKVSSTDSNFVSNDGKSGYAEFVISKGFKGQIWAIVADKVAVENPATDGFRHSSGLIYADGTIVEDAALHQSTSSVTIIENEETTNRDANGLPLHNANVPLTVSLQDTFSGIGQIEWSIANDNISGVITIANDGTIQNNSEYVTVLEDTVKRESNLVTALQFGVTSTSNTNNNVLNVKLIDRAGNESTAMKQYSIDTTVPVITATLSNQNPTHERYYNTNQVITVSIAERNFNPSNVRFEINGSLVSINNWSSSGEGDQTMNVGSYEISNDGDYAYRISFTDMAGNNAVDFTQEMFTVDKTQPTISTNFGEFSNTKDNFFGIGENGEKNKTARITITEHNFSVDQANVEIRRKVAGSSHDSNGMEVTKAYRWRDNGDEHTVEIPFGEGDDGVYQITVAPVDLANNNTEMIQSAVFEIDYTSPVISQRNGVEIFGDEKAYSNLEIYNEQTGLPEGFIPSVGFTDTNFDHLEYELIMYTPEYGVDENQMQTKEMKSIVPVTDSNKIKDKVYKLPEFEKDGIYSVNLVAVDKAGNKSTVCKNTSVLMMESDMLAYITDSNKAEGTGWYSIQKDENTPISKRPDSFEDLSITVFAQNDSDTKIVLRDENGDSKDTGITAEGNEDMYAVGVYNYKLPKEYFVDNYPEGTNKDLYLWAENTVNNETSHVTLGWIRIDALEPSCDLPKDLKNWKAYTSNTKDIVLTNISETLDVSQCIVHDNGKKMDQSHFIYSEENGTLTYTLNKGWHDISFTLVDEAGNIHTVQEISSIQVGLLYCLWFRILCGVIAVAVIAGIAFAVVKRRTANN